MTILEKIFKMYSECGILTRSDDGVHPITLQELKESIGKIVLSESDLKPNSDKVLHLGNLLPNNGPTYSASLLGQNKFPVLWYFFKYSDSFSPDKLPEHGNRNTLVVIFKPSAIFVHAICLWDADSNDRDTGQLPNNPIDDKAIAQNDFANRKIFDGIGNYRFNNTKSLNNFAWYNPLIRPETPESIAKSKEEICSFLNELGSLKEYWVSHLENEAKGFNNVWADYITSTYGSGVESEVFTTPKYDATSIFGKLKFSIDDVETMAFVTDGLTHDTHTIAEYENEVRTFFSNNPGWIHPPTKEEIENIPIISIKRVALPNVNIDSKTSSAVGEDWLKYLAKDDTYQKPLELDDFKTIREAK